MVHEVSIPRRELKVIPLFFSFLLDPSIPRRELKVIPAPAPGPLTPGVSQEGS